MASCWSLVSSVVGVKLERLRVTFVSILEAQMGASLCKAAGGKLALEQMFWNPPIGHAGNMSEPAEVLQKQCAKTGESSAG